MQDNDLYQMLRRKSDQIDLKLEDIIETEDENIGGASASTKMKFRRVMTQREMEILTTLFPKTAQTLAGVLRNQPD
jgi:hypothetical protein